MDIYLEGEDHAYQGHGAGPPTPTTSTAPRGRRGDTRNPLMPIRAQRSGGGKTGHETQSDPTIASCTCPTNLFVHAAPYVHVSIRTPPPPPPPTTPRNTSPRDFEGPESCQRSLDEDYTSLATDFDKSRRVALDPPPPPPTPQNTSHGVFGALKSCTWRPHGGYTNSTATIDKAKGGAPPPPPHPTTFGIG